MNKHLGSNERYPIQIGWAQGLPASVIAQGMGYSKSAVHREIARNSGGADVAFVIDVYARQIVGWR